MLNLDFGIFCQNTMDTSQALASCWAQDGDISYLHWMVNAWGWTVAVALVAIVIAVVLGVVIGTLRTLPHQRAISGVADGYVELFRNIPLLVQLLLWYHVVPVFIPALKSVDGFWLATAALGVFTSARVAEQVRAGILALPKGQWNAAMALGLSKVQAYRLVMLPNALRIVLPTLTSDAMNVFKNSSVAFAVSVAELTQFAMQAQEETGRGIEIYLAVTALYIVSAFLVNRLCVAIEKRTQLPGMGDSRAAKVHAVEGGV